MAHGLSGLVGEEILLRDVGHILGVIVLGKQVIEGLILARTNVFGDGLPPFFGIVENRVDVEITPRNGNSRCLTSWPIENLA